MAHATDVFNEVEKRASALISKSTTALDKASAYSAVFKQDPQLYARYRNAQQLDIGSQVMLTKQDGSTVPGFASALLERQLDDFMDYLGALATTLRGILASAATDKGAQIAQALDDFRTAVVGALHQAGLEVPTAKQALIPPALEKELLYTMLKLAPRDPLGRGGVVLAKALQQVRQDLAA
jgi:hypothetical protein